MENVNNKPKETKPQPKFSAKLNCMIYPTYDSNGKLIYVTIPERD